MTEAPTRTRAAAIIEALESGAPQIALESRYRIGDAVAVLLMTKLIEQRYGPKQWVLLQPNNIFCGLFEEYIQAAGNAMPDILMPRDGQAMQRTLALPRLPDDGRLWMWNQVCHQIGFRLDWAPTKQRPYRIVFAPLPEADYSAERCMHPYFIRDLAQHLSQFPDAVMILPEKPGYHDFDLFREIPIMKIHGPMRECIEIIGNADIFIGGDTGFSHIAGCFPNVRQIAVHDRANTERHVEREYDHMAEHREFVLAVCAALGVDVHDTEYRSFPNKRNATCILSDYGGMDGHAMKEALIAMDRMLTMEDAA